MMQVAEQDDTLNTCVLNSSQALAKSVSNFIWKLSNASVHIQMSRPLPEFSALSRTTEGSNLTKF